jgi:hypothetical protein
MSFRVPVVCAICTLAMHFACSPDAGAAAPSSRSGGAQRRDNAPSWGAIAYRAGSYGYAFNHDSRGAAERAARNQCDRAAGRAGACEVLAYFDRACGALATGNYGEWATAISSTNAAAGRAAVERCDAHLPTEPCKIVVSICSAR